MKLILISILLTVTIHSLAQKKVFFDVEAGVLQPAGKDISTSSPLHTNPSLTLNYFSRNKFSHPYFNVLVRANYSLHPDFRVGLQSEFYIHYSEKYFSNTPRTTLSIPLMATFSYKICDINLNQLGITVAGGKIFYKIDDGLFKINDGALYNVAAFFTMNKKSTVKLGIEKQIDNVGFYYTADEPGYKNEIYKYHLNRLSLFVSYGLRLGK
jgi:hypothetical protein